MKTEFRWRTGEPVCHLGQLDQALAENAVLSRELGRIQCRLTGLVRAQVGRIDELEAEVLRLRAEVICMRTQQLCLEEALRDAEASVVPDVRSRAKRALRSLSLRPFRTPCAP